MKRCRAFTILAILLALSGCGDLIEFEADTLALPDGAVTRKTRFIVGRDSSKQEVETRYDMPPHGKWESGTRIRRESDGKETEEPTKVYEAQKQYPPGSAMEQDYARKAEFSDQYASNEPRIAVRNYFFVKTFAYEEGFRDIVTAKSFETTVRKAYMDVIERGQRSSR